MIRPLAVMVVLSAPLLAQEPTPRNLKLDPGNHRIWLQVGDLLREYLLHVPEGYDSRGPAPLLLMFHGSGGTLDGMANISGWISQSEEKKYLVVLANGFPNQDGMRVWNDGRSRGDKQADDVAFVRAMITDVASRLKVNRKRIFVAGFSNGAGLSYRLAVEMGDVIAAIAPVAGRLSVPVQALARPVPAISIVGTKDGGYDSDVRAVEGWAGLVGCAPAGDTTRNGRFTSISFKDCPGDTDVISYTLQDWEHYWPGGKNPGVEMWAEKTIWKFFERHPLQNREEGRGKREE